MDVEDTMSQAGSGKSNIKKPLARAMTGYCVVFAVVFAILMGMMSFFVYEHDMLDRYHAYTADLLNYVARSTDGEDLLQCMKTGKKSEKYEELQKLTNHLKETHKVEFLYIIEPISENPPDNMMDVLAAYTEQGKADGTDGLTDLGKFTGNAYPPDVARQYMARMDRNPKVTFFPNDTEFGNIYTAIRPIFDSKGNPIAVLCADVLISEINEGRLRFITISLLAGLFASMVLSAVMSYWLSQRVAAPIERLRNSATAFARECHGSRELESLFFDDPGIHTQDEMEDLTKAVSSMCDDMKAYTKELIAADRKVGNLTEKVVQMDALAYTDTLTGAGNKAAYERLVTRIEWDLLAEKEKFAMVMVDLNYLKRINDNFGHDRGNQYIKRLYTILRENSETAKIFRIGGDEFVVIFHETACEEVNVYVDKVREEMKLTMQDSSLEPWERVSAAIGVCFYNHLRHSTVSDVFNEADAAMYQDKKNMRAVRE